MTVRTIPATTDFYVLGGTVPRDARSYVVRQADSELLDALRRRQFCYVLTSRQMGKSSLMVRTVTRLRQERITCLVLDLTSIGQNLTEEQWYDGLLNRIALQLDLEPELDAFWTANTRLGPLQRWIQALETIVLTSRSGHIVIFIDEIDVVRSLPFSTDEFFAAVRSCYNRRTEEPEFERLTFCLLGVATPADLIRDTRSTPFNIGTRIELTDFTETEALPLAEGLNQVLTPSPETQDLSPSLLILRRVLYWTGGQPYLTQRLCAAVAERTGVHAADTPRSLVDATCEELFLSRAARNRDDNLLFVRERLLRSEADRAGLLEIYARIRAGRRVKDDETNPLLSVLRLSGIVRADSACLQVRNRIYTRIFDRDWIRANMPDAELRRQKMAYRRGFIRATTLGLGMVTLTGWLTWTAVQRSKEAHSYALLAKHETILAQTEAVHAQTEAVHAQHEAARAQTEAARAQTEADNAHRHLYAADMGLAQQAWSDKNYGRVRELLLPYQVPKGQLDLRGFEWWQLWHRGHFDLPYLPNPSGYVCTNVGFSTDGTTLRTSDGHGTITFWDAQTGAVVPAPADKTFDIHSMGTSSQKWGLVSPDGRYRAEGTHYESEEEDYPHSAVTLRDRKTNRTYRLPKTMPAFAFSPDSKILATQSLLDDIVLWETATGRQRGVLHGGSGPLAFSPDGTRLAASSYAYGWGIKLFDVSTDREPHTLPGTADAVAVASQGTLMATEDTDWNGVTLWDEKTQRVLRKLEEAAPPLALSPDGRMLATGTRPSDGTMILWDTASGKEKARLRADANQPMGMTFSEDGRLMAAYTYSGSVTLWDVAAHRLLRSFRGCSVPAFSPDGKLLAVPDTGDPKIASHISVILYDVTTGNAVRTLHGASAPIAFSPNRPLLATSGGDGTMQMWNGETGVKVGTALGGHRYGIQACTFSPDGKRLVAGDTGEYKVILWDTKTGRETFHIPGQTDRTDVASYGLAFSPDGMRLYSGNQDGVIKVWGHEKETKSR